MDKRAKEAKVEREARERRRADWLERDVALRQRRSVSTPLSSNNGGYSKIFYVMFQNFNKISSI